MTFLCDIARGAAFSSFAGVVILAIRLAAQNGDWWFVSLLAVLVVGIAAIIWNHRP